MSNSYPCAVIVEKIVHANLPEKVGSVSLLGEQKERADDECNQRCSSYSLCLCQQETVNYAMRKRTWAKSGWPSTYVHLHTSEHRLRAVAPVARYVRKSGRSMKCAARPYVSAWCVFSQRSFPI